MTMEIRDGAWTLLDFQPDTGRQVWMTFQDDQMIFRVDMPCEAIFDANQEAEIETMGRRFGDYRRVASIPHNLAYSSGVRDAIDQGDEKWLSRFMNDPDNRKLRTSRGRV